MTSNLALLEEALTCHKGGNYSGALLKYKSYFKHETQNPVAWECYSTLLLGLSRFDNCAEACRNALALKPDSEMAKKNLTIALNNMLIERVIEGNQGEFINVSEQIINLKFSDPGSLAWERCYMELLAGDFHKGLELYEIRLKLPSFNGNKGLSSAPRWDGRPYQGKRLLIHAEQGFGDSIMMARYFEQIKALGGELHVFVLPGIGDISSTYKGPDYIFDDPEDKMMTAFDIQLPMMSIPLVLNTTLETIPSHIPYICVPQNVPNREQIDARIATAVHSKKIGLTWSGRPSHKRDSERSIPIELLRPLEEVQGVSWFCLQRELPEAIPVQGAIPLGDLLVAFSDTAYALSRLDQLITVDTSVAHLAGALGVPVWNLITFMPDWRWLLWRSDSPWYSNMKLYRQPTPGDWPAVIEQVVSGLREG
jgi:tetratricopeptide (TPR) repeat protein